MMTCPKGCFSNLGKIKRCSSSQPFTCTVYLLLCSGTVNNLQMFTVSCLFSPRLGGRRLDNGRQRPFGTSRLQIRDVKRTCDNIGFASYLGFKDEESVGRWLVRHCRHLLQAGKRIQHATSWKHMRSYNAYSYIIYLENMFIHIFRDVHLLRGKQRKVHAVPECLPRNAGSKREESKASEPMKSRPCCLV